MKKKLSQAEYDAEIKKINEERNREYNDLDKRAFENKRQMYLLQEQRRDIVRKMQDLELANKWIDVKRNETCRFYNEKRIALRKMLHVDVLPKELSSEAAHRLSYTLEKKLKEVLAGIADIETEGIKCNFNYTQEGKIDLSVNIPCKNKE